MRTRCAHAETCPRTVAHSSSRGTEGYGPVKSRQPPRASAARHQPEAVRGNGANSARGDRRAGEDEKEDSMSTAMLSSTASRRLGTLREGAFGNATNPVLPRVRPPGRARPVLRVSGVLRAAGDRLRLPHGHPRGDRGRPAATSGATRRCCRCRPTSSRAPTPSPASPGCSARNNLGRELGITNLWVKDDSTNPTNSFKDRVVACALSAAREFGAKVFACPSHRQPRQRRGRCRCPRRHQDRGLHPEQPRAAEAGQLRDLHREPGRRRTATTTTSTSSPPRSPARRRAGRSSTSTSAPTTPRARRRWATRSPSSSAGGCPTRS